MTAATKNRPSASKVRATSRDSETIVNIISLSFATLPHERTKTIFPGWYFKHNSLSARGLMLQENTAEPKFCSNKMKSVEKCTRRKKIKSRYLQSLATDLLAVGCTLIRIFSFLSISISLFGKLTSWGTNLLIFHFKTETTNLLFSYLFFFPNWDSIGTNPDYFQTFFIGLRLRYYSSFSRMKQTAFRSCRKCLFSIIRFFSRFYLFSFWFYIVTTGRSEQHSLVSENRTCHRLVEWFSLHVNALINSSSSICPSRLVAILRLSIPLLHYDKFSNHFV